MRWRRWSDYEPRPRRPAVTKLNKDQLGDLAGKLNAAVTRSPVLAGLGVRVRAERGRFYVERVRGDRPVLWGRITPVVNDGPLLLECEGRSNQWYEVAQTQMEAVDLRPRRLRPFFDNSVPILPWGRAGNPVGGQGT